LDAIEYVITTLYAAFSVQQGTNLPQIARGKKSKFSHLNFSSAAALFCQSILSFVGTKAA